MFHAVNTTTETCQSHKIIGKEFWMGCGLLVLEDLVLTPSCCCWMTCSCSPRLMMERTKTQPARMDTHGHDGFEEDFLRIELLFQASFQVRFRVSLKV